MRHESQRKQQMSRRWECRICRVVSRDLSCLVSTLTRRSPGRRMGRGARHRARPRGGRWTCGAVAVDCNRNCPKHTQKRKELARSSADGRAVHGRRCLHGLCHGSQWPWLTSAMQTASPEVARARGPLNSLHPLVSSGGANNSALLLSRPQLFLAMPTLHHSIAARRSMPAVRLLSVEACL